jgi:hypothetical protein
MQWFKHHNDFRRSPAMKRIGESLGDRGIAAAYCLLEVMCEQCGSGANYSPVLVLEPPHDVNWLGHEIFFPDEMEAYNAGITIKETESVLSNFVCSGLIYLDEKRCGRTVQNEKTGKWETKEIVFPTIELIGFEERLDEWTEREIKKARKTGIVKPGTPRVTLATMKASAKG